MNLEKIRQEKGFSQRGLDLACGFRVGTVNDIESGRNGNPSWDVVRRIAKILNVGPEEIFPEKESESGSAA